MLRREKLNTQSECCILLSAVSCFIRGLFFLRNVARTASNRQIETLPRRFRIEKSALDGKVHKLLAFLKSKFLGLDGSFVAVAIIIFLQNERPFIHE
jgi:hypothetical protein